MEQDAALLCQLANEVSDAGLWLELNRRWAADFSRYQSKQGLLLEQQSLDGDANAGFDLAGELRTNFALLVARLDVALVRSGGVVQLEHVILLDLSIGCRAPPQVQYQLFDVSL